MKKILAGLLLLGNLVSCSLSDDPVRENNDNIHNTNILGTWKFQTEYQVSGNDLKIVINQSLPDNCKQKSTYEFRNDGKYYISDYNSIHSDCIQKETTLPYLYSPNQMKLIINNNESEVLELTFHQLVILVPAYYDYNGDGTNDYLKTVYYK